MSKAQHALYLTQLVMTWDLYIPDDFILDLQGLQVAFATVVVEHILPDVVASPHLLDLRVQKI